MFTRRSIAGGLTALAVVGVTLASPAAAQLLGRPIGGVSLPNLPPVIQPADRLLAGAAANLSPAGLLDLRAARLREIIRAHPAALEADDHGAPVVRGEVLLVAPTEASLVIARRAGFTLASRRRIEALDMDLAVLEAPPGTSVRAAIRTLRRLDPAGRYDFNHIFEAAGVAAGGPAPGPGAAPPGSVRANTAIGLVDTGVDASHAAFSGVRIEQRAFASGGVVRQAHGTEVASLIAGRDGRFVGADPGAALRVADVYGASPTGGAADTLVGALAWLAAGGTRVINISLVGPPDLALEMAVRTLVARGVAIVAPVGNDGPAAPPAYPASWPGVIAVTAVNARGAVLPEAGHARHLDFAAPGAGMTAAAPGGGYASVRGASFAAPIVAGALAVELDRAGGSARLAADRLAGEGRRGAAFGRALVGMDLRTPPARVAAAAH